MPLRVIVPGDARVTSPAVPSVEKVFNAPVASMLLSLRLSILISPPLWVPWERIVSVRMLPFAVKFTFPAVPLSENVSIGWPAFISPRLLVISISPPLVGVSGLRALAVRLPVVMSPRALIVIFPEPSGERELMMPALVSIVPLLLVMLMLPATPDVACPWGRGIRVKLSFISNRSLTKPEARSI